MKIGYVGPDKCPLCGEEMFSWFHLESHQEELQQRLHNPTDSVITELRAFGVAVHDPRGPFNGGL